jgi:VanZ family protein
LKRETERRLTAWVPPTAYVLLIFGVSSIPQLRPVIGEFRLSDKVSHLIEYAGFGALVLWAFLGTLPRERRRWALPLTVALGAVVGILDELYQITVPGRLFEGLDWVADVLGSLVGALVASLVHRGLERRRAAAGDCGTRTEDGGA